MIKIVKEILRTIPILQTSIIRRGLKSKQAKSMTFSGHLKKKTGLVVEAVEEQTEYSQQWKILNQLIDLDHCDFY